MFLIVIIVLLVKMCSTKIKGFYLKKNRSLFTKESVLSKNKILDSYLFQTELIDLYERRLRTPALNLCYLLQKGIQTLY